ncbi:MAG TPA: beta-ketoacyl synthase, partial [Thermoanaerobaculia bacterium]|nr:beta-ketoacyl synthase [Thermoanaerobaculia bacterium]
MDLPTLYAIGAFIQALGQNPGIEAELARLGSRAHIYLGTGLGAVGTIADAALSLERAQRRWDRFWGEGNPARPASGPGPEGAPPPPESVPAAEREDAERAWWHHWAGSAPDLHAYLKELAEIESLSVQGEVAAGKMSVIKERQRRHAQLQKRWGCP